MGGAKPTRDAVLDVDVFMGSVELRVPDEWTVTVNGAPTFGSIEQSLDRLRLARNHPRPAVTGPITVDISPGRQGLRVLHRLDED